eukprot:2828164-Pleurochrysis_carterae.AAC.1
MLSARPSPPLQPRWAEGAGASSFATAHSTHPSVTSSTFNSDPFARLPSLLEALNAEARAESPLTPLSAQTGMRTFGRGPSVDLMAGRSRLLQSADSSKQMQRP